MYRINQLEEIKEAMVDIITSNIEKLNDEISDEIDNSYKKGLLEGLRIDQDLQKINNGLDLKSIKVFAKWCYLNGIDFSYMAKRPGDNFIERVIEKFINDNKGE